MCFTAFTNSGFDLCEVGQEEVVLKTGKQASRRTVHFALQSLMALFGKKSFPCYMADMFVCRCRNENSYFPNDNYQFIYEIVILQENEKLNILNNNNNNEC